jgi:hypothetical protein
MSDELRPLETLQRWMQEVITHPLGVEAGIGSDGARSEIDASVADIESVIEPSAKCTSIERLNVYGNAYFSRLLECMRELFPATAFAVGEEAFDQFTLEYLQIYPPYSYTLEYLSDRFVKFLEETRPDESDSGDDHHQPTWADFVIDLARLEWTIDQVFDGPGVEQQSQLTAEQLQAIPPDQWPHACITVAPCLRLLELRFPVNDFYTAFRQDTEPDFPEATQSLAAISRRDYIVRRFDLSRPQYALLAALMAGETIEQAIAAGANAFFAAGGDEEQLATALPRWFQNWTAEGFFLEIKHPAN